MRRSTHRRVTSVEDRLPPELHPLLRRIYLNRGLSEAAELDTGLERLLPYGQLKGIDAAASLLADALRQQKHICVVGDYDVDGATSTALMMIALADFGATRLSYLVPDRFRFGYGLTPPIVEIAAQRGAELLITVDNGIASIEGVETARRLGMSVLITDHHLPAAALPDANAIVNPNQPGCEFPSKALAGVGVAFYVMAALRALLRANGAFCVRAEPNLAALLDLVALGTVADVVPLDHNNRILVAQGIRNIRSGRSRPGIKALLQVSGRDAERLSATDLGYALGPRLNAAGRLDDMSVGIECLLSHSDEAAIAIARRLDDLNRERREIQTQMQDEAMDAVAMLEGQAELPMSLCLFDEGWHQGVVGLVAGRLKERFHRPAIAFAPGEEPGLLKGSARSVTGLHIRDALDTIATQHPGLITKFGGHAMAAGLSLALENLDSFRAAFEAETQRWLTQGQVSGAIETDGELAADTLTLDCAQKLRDGGPWGQGFAEPLFDGEFVVAESRIVGDRHLKLRLRGDGLIAPIEAIAFNTSLPVKIGDRLKLAYRLDVNEYLGRRSVQLVIEYIEAEAGGRKESA